MVSSKQRFGNAWKDSIPETISSNEGLDQESGTADCDCPTQHPYSSKNSSPPLQEPSTSKKYIVKADAVVELLVRALSSACDSLTYATDIAIPTVSDYEDFTMPTKPDITTLKVKSTDKM